MPRLLLAFLLIITTMGASTASLDALVLLHVTPLIQLAPGKVRYDIRIPAHRDNFWFCYGWDNIDTLVGRTSCQQLQGIYGPR